MKTTLSELVLLAFLPRITLAHPGLAANVDVSSTIVPYECKEQE